MADVLDGRKVAVLATHGFEQSELIEPVNALRDAGAVVDIVAPEGGAIRGWDHTDWGESVDVDRTIEEALARADEYDGLVLPGGVLNPDKLRVRDDALRFVRTFFDDGRPVAAICHGAQTLIDCGVVEGREMTSYHAVKTDLENAGARWVDREVVVDGNLISSRNPNDLPAFNAKLIEALRAAVPAGRKSG